MLASLVCSKEWKEARTCLDFYYHYYSYCGCIRDDDGYTTPPATTKKTPSSSTKPTTFDRRLFVYEQYLKTVPRWMRLEIEIFMTNNTCTRKFKGGDAVCPNPTCKNQHAFGLQASYLHDEAEREELRATKGLTGLDLITGAYEASLLVYDGCLEHIFSLEAKTHHIEFISEVDGATRHSYPCFVDPYEEKMYWKCHKCQRELLMKRETFENLLMEHRKKNRDGGYVCRKHAEYFDMFYQLNHKRQRTSRVQSACDGTIVDLLRDDHCGSLDQMRLTWKRFFQYWTEVYIAMLNELVFHAPAKKIQRVVRRWLMRRLEPAIAEYGTPQFKTALRSLVRMQFYSQQERHHKCNCCEIAAK